MNTDIERFISLFDSVGINHYEDIVNDGFILNIEDEDGHFKRFLFDVYGMFLCLMSD